MSGELNIFTSIVEIAREFALQLFCMIVAFPLAFLFFLGASELPNWMQASLPFLSLAVMTILAALLVRGFWRLIKRDING